MTTCNHITKHLLRKTSIALGMSCNFHNVNIVRFDLLQMIDASFTITHLAGKLNALEHFASPVLHAVDTTYHWDGIN